MSPNFRSHSIFTINIEMMSTGAGDSSHIRKVRVESKVQGVPKKVQGVPKKVQGVPKKV